jgi:hypothetical protein
MDEVLRSRSARPMPNERARAALLVGVLAVAVLPAALALAAYSAWVDLAETAAAIPIALVLGVVAVALGRRARRVSDISLGRIGGRGAARVGSALGGLGIYLACMCALAVAFFGVLLLFQ